MLLSSFQPAFQNVGRFGGEDWALGPSTNIAFGYFNTIGLGRPAMQRVRPRAGAKYP